MPVVDRRAPVIVGAGQNGQRTSPELARPPIALLADAARAADADTGARVSLLERTDVVAVVAIGSWKYPDPGALLARTLGISPRATATSTVGGNSPQLLIDEFADAYPSAATATSCSSAGPRACTPAGAHAREPRVELDWETGDDPPCPIVIGDDAPGSSEYEMAHLAVAPTIVYPLFETARRAALGHGVDEHQRYVSELWSRFSVVAAGNPHAWSRVAYTPEEIRTISDDNRVVCFPYPKRMCANIDVDQGAAVLLCSYGAARDAGVPDDRIVFLHAAAEAHDHWFLTERHALAHSPAMAATGAAVFASTGTTARRHRALRSVLVLSGRGPDRRGRARHRPGRRPSAHGHRRPRVRGRSGQQLPDPRRRDDGRRAPPFTRRHRAHHRARLVPDQARGRDLVGAAARATASGGSTPRPAVDALPGARPPDSSTPRP